MVENEVQEIAWGLRPEAAHGIPSSHSSTLSVLPPQALHHLLSLSISFTDTTGTFIKMCTYSNPHHLTIPRARDTKK